jgi:hypothetical protein
MLLNIPHRRYHPKPAPTKASRLDFKEVALICLSRIIAGAAFIAGVAVQYDKVAWAMLVLVAIIVAVVLMMNF